MTHSKPNNRARRQIDWPAIKVDYLQGRPISAIARRFGVGSTTIYTHIQRHGWSREDTSDLPALELAQLRGLAGKLRERLENLIDGDRHDGGAVIGSRESPAALLLKLCQITEKITSMESRIAGTDMPTAARLSEQDHEILKRFKSRHGLSGS